MAILQLKILDPHVALDGDGCWPDLTERMARPSNAGEATGLHIAGLARGLASGQPSVTIRLDFGDGSSRIVQTSLALFLTAADALRACYGDPRTQMP